LISGDAFEILIRAIALQLLASCYTLLPASSACSLPLLHQKRWSTPISALRLHSQYRFEPAAGHHARASSESASWPGLYAGPTLEDALADAVSRQTSHRYNSEHTLHFSESGWTDGTSSPPSTHRTRGVAFSKKHSNSSSELGFFSRLICQASLPKSPARKHNTLFTNFTSRKKRGVGALNSPVSPSETGPNRPKLVQHLGSQAVQRIPSSLRLRRTQSAPRITVDTAIPSDEPYTPRRHGSNPSIGSPLNYPFEIPEMQSTSVTPAASPSAGATSASVRMCGRGDLITLQEYLDESEVNAPRQSIKRHGDTLSPYVQNTSAISPLAISPRGTSVVAPSRQQQPTDYFASVHVMTHVHNNKDHNIDDSEDLRGEREDAGPSIYECPILQEIFAKMDAPPGAYSSDSEDSTESIMRRERKRKSILVEAGSTDGEMVGLFGSPHEKK
jgi:hypothetical protein